MNVSWSKRIRVIMMISMNAYYKVDGQKLIFNKENSYSNFVANTIGFYKVYFTFDSTWNEFDTKLVIFENGKSVSSVLTAVDNMQYMVDMPSEVLEKEGNLSVSLVGYYSNDNKKRYTTNCDSNLEILPSCYKITDSSTQPDLSEVEKLRIEVENLKKDYSNIETLDAADANLFMDNLLGGN